MELDQWQQEVLDCQSKRIAIRAGRQSGKSTVIALKAANYALNNPNKLVLVIASVERQAQLLFEKIHQTIYSIDKKAWKVNQRPTKQYVKLKNGTSIWCVPTGESGYGIRGFTVDLLIADEAHYIPQEVFTAISPMLAVTGGTFILLSTPKGANGYFYECFTDPNFTTWHVSSENCPRIPKEFLDQEKKRMTKMQYQQEYQAEFLENIQKFFPTSLIKECTTIQERNNYVQGAEYYLGLDFARYGGDENAFVIVELNDTKVNVVSCETTSMVSTAETIQRVLELDRRYKFKRIFLDDGGLGAPILDQFLVTTQVMSKVVGINNASRFIDNDSERRDTKKLMKEELYYNLKVLMEQRNINLLSDDNLFQSLDCIQFEIKDTDTLHQRTLIYGTYTHLCEALIRAAWCVRTKSLNLWVRYS